VGAARLLSLRAALSGALLSVELAPFKILLCPLPFSTILLDLPVPRFPRKSWRRMQKSSFARLIRSAVHRSRETLPLLDLIITAESTRKLLQKGSAKDASYPSVLWLPVTS
jgi:hypothetical protein